MVDTIGPFLQSDQNLGSLKEELKIIVPQIEEMRKRKVERRNQFLEVLDQIQKISSEIYCSSEYTPYNTIVDESDLSLRKLEELHRELQSLQKEKVIILCIYIYTHTDIACSFFRRQIKL